MNQREKELFKVSLVRQYDEIWQYDGSYKYSYFNNELVDLEDDELDCFVKQTIKSLKDQQKLIKKLKNISINSIENDLDPKIYKLLQHWDITNIYYLRRNLYRRYNGEIVSKIPGISTVKGSKILDVLDKHNIPSNFYTTRWQ
jgi:hypothetical protein